MSLTTISYNIKWKWQQLLCKDLAGLGNEDPVPTLKSMPCSVMLGLGPQTTFLLIPCQALAGEGGSNTRKECQGRGDRGYSLLPVCSPCTSCLLPVPVSMAAPGFPTLDGLSLPLGVVGSTLQLLQGPSDTPAPVGQPLPQKSLGNAIPPVNV